eukprot:TRINITY_DN767_c1_g1_i1.p1 TRINITY_DN767_c1_g1~~TRINITY_DN767_c1_g1_i1.p1  ORF type:complete len:263 (-),score=41.90 TRINITY_DN767_c1_g1_i1:95-883(-)
MAATIQKQRELSQQQVEDFHRDGFLVLRAEDMWTPEAVENLRNWTDDVGQWPEVAGKWMSYYSKAVNGTDKRLLHRVENFFPYHNGYNTMFNSPEFLYLIAQLFGEQAILHKEKINFKYPGGEGFKPHQDHAAGWDMYDQDLHISALVSVDEATRENGCLEVVAGKHKQGLLCEKFKELPDSFVESVTWIPVLTKPGDVVFFDSFVPHRSEANLSNAPRRVLYSTYSKKSQGDFRERYYSDKRKSFPPDIEREQGKNYEYKI